MSGAGRLRVGVIGGSYGGLCSALAMRCVGADVHVFERTPQFDRVGGGIVVQPDFAEYLEAFGYARPDVVAVPARRRRFISRDGTARSSSSDSTFYTGWDTVLRALRDSLGPAQLHNGRTLTGLRQSGDSVEATFDGGATESFDLLIACDGIGSTARRILEPEATPKYAGYAGFRGLVRERDIDGELAEQFRDAFTLFSYENSHILGYFIPGENGELEPGSRRFNWVWYITIHDSQLGRLLTDGSGRQHRASLAPGELSGEWESWLREKAENELPEQFAGMVRTTPAPFVQAIFDLEVSRMIHGRVALLGDAAFLVRPHTASGTSKAAGDAVSLAHAVGGLGPSRDALEGWELERMSVAHQIMSRGRRIADHGGLGR